MPYTPYGAQPQQGQNPQQNFDPRMQQQAQGGGPGMQGRYQPQPAWGGGGGQQGGGGQSGMPQNSPMGQPPGGPQMGPPQGAYPTSAGSAPMGGGYGSSPMLQDQAGTQMQQFNPGGAPSQGSAMPGVMPRYQMQGAMGALQQPQGSSQMQQPSMPQQNQLRGGFSPGQGQQPQQPQAQPQSQRFAPQQQMMQQPQRQPMRQMQQAQPQPQQQQPVQGQGLMDAHYGTSGGGGAAPQASFAGGGTVLGPNASPAENAFESQTSKGVNGKIPAFDDGGTVMGAAQPYANGIAGALQGLQPGLGQMKQPMQPGQPQQPVAPGSGVQPGQVGNAIGGLSRYVMNQMQQPATPGATPGGWQGPMQPPGPPAPDADAQAPDGDPDQMAMMASGGVVLGPKEPPQDTALAGTTYTEPGAAMRRYSPVMPIAPKVQLSPKPEEMGHHLPTKLRIGKRINVKLPRPSSKGLGGVKGVK